MMSGAGRSVRSHLTMTSRNSAMAGAGGGRTPRVGLRGSVNADGFWKLADCDARTYSLAELARKGIQDDDASDDIGAGKVETVIQADDEDKKDRAREPETPGIQVRTDWTVTTDKASSGRQTSPKRQTSRADLRAESRER